MSSFWRIFYPFLKWFPSVDKDSIRADIMAGLTGAVIVLPQGIAYAAIAGLPPQYGLYTSMITPVIAALFGSSLHLISGPTAAISIVVFSALSGHAEPGTAEFISLALTLTFLAGLFQFVFGLARLGSLVNFVSHTVVIGFTAGAAILIGTSQLKYVFGMEIPRGESFLHTWIDMFNQVGDINYYIFAVAAVTLIVAMLVRKFLPKFPYLLFGMVAGGLSSLLIGGESHGVKLVGAIPRGLPPFSAPEFSFETIKSLIPDAFAIALLGLVEAVSIARSVAAKSKQQIDGSQEFIGQGLSNMVGSFFSSYAGSGSFTRSGINYDSGAKSPLSAIFASVFLLLIVLLIAPVTAYLPIASMGASILLVAYNLVDFYHIKQIFRISLPEASIFLTTFLATLFLELEFAIYMGVLVSLFLFVGRTSYPKIISLAPNPKLANRSLQDVYEKKLDECPQLKIIRIDMSIYFGSLAAIQKEFHKLTKAGYRYILIDSSGINFIDMAGSEMLEQEAKRLEELGGGLFFYNIKDSVFKYLLRSDAFKHIGDYHFFPSKKGAIQWVFTQLDEDVCITCPRRIFKECSTVDREPS
ncbi:MAG TPA: SulP family inorganic anion transporter [Leucothrix sp.]|nr:SulP family inorganic anion transporter [Leucothrix sp.]